MVHPSLAPICCVVYAEVRLFLNVTGGSVSLSARLLWDCLGFLFWQLLLFLCFCKMFEIRLYWSISQTSQQWRSWEAAEKLSDQGSENQKWISSSEMKTEAGVESFPKCLDTTVCLFQPFLLYAYCVKLLILLHKHRKWKKRWGYWQMCKLLAASFLKFKDGLAHSF